MTDKSVELRNKLFKTCEGYGTMDVLRALAEAPAAVIVQSHSRPQAPRDRFVNFPRDG
jgi:hypothetical protein